MRNQIILPILFVYLIMALSCGNQDEEKRRDVPTQVDNTMNFRRFTAMVVVTRKGETFPACGFFVKYAGKYFLVTNDHVVTGIDNMRKTSQGSMESVAVIYNTIKGAKAIGAVPDEYIPKNPKPFFFYEKPDLIVLPMPDMSGDTSAMSIEQYMTEIPTKDKLPLSVFCYSYQGSKMKPELGINQNPEKWKFTVKTSVHADTVINYNSTTNPRDISSYYLVSPVVERGMPGTPVFNVYDSIVNGQHFDYTVFSGVISSSFERNGMCLIVKPKELLRLLEAAAKNNKPASSY